jgi:peptide subunit release factor 1 (eRF1)
MSMPILDRKETLGQVLPAQLMARLLEIAPREVPVISLYLDARADHHGRQNFTTFVRKQLTEKARTFPVHTRERESVEADFVRVASYLEEVAPSAQGVAIFTCSGEDEFFEAGQFDAPFPRNQLFVYDRPHLYPLARLIDQFRSYAVLLADTNRAQIFVFASRRAVDHKELQNVKTKQAQIGGWGQSRYQRHLENYHLHHAKEALEVLERTVRDEQIDDVILAGDEQTVIPLLKQQMPKALAEKVTDVLSLGIDTREHQLMEESLKAFRSHDALTDMEKVERLLGEYRRDGLAVAGVPETLAALSNGQVEELLIAASVAAIQYDENEVQKVLEAYGEDSLPATLDQRTVADELVRRANQLSSARIGFIEDSTRLEQVGGVGALLRYRISSGSAAPYEQAGVASKSKALVERSAS